MWNTELFHAPFISIYISNASQSPTLCMHWATSCRKCDYTSDIKAIKVLSQRISWKHLNRRHSLRNFPIIAAYWARCTFTVELHCNIIIPPHDSFKFTSALYNTIRWPKFGNAFLSCGCHTGKYDLLYKRSRISRIVVRFHYGAR